MNTVYIALGSNISPRYSFLTEAINELNEQENITVTAKSSVYETAPVGYTDQGPFLNMVIKVNTTLKPIEILDCCQTIEKELGRKRKIRWGPRTIDLDILLYNQENIKTEQLIVPHPRMTERAFVLIPLKEINPHAFLPASNKLVSEILDETSVKEKKGVWKWYPKNGESV